MRTSSCVYLHPDEILAQPDFYLQIYLKYKQWARLTPAEQAGALAPTPAALLQALHLLYKKVF